MSNQTQSLIVLVVDDDKIFGLLHKVQFEISDVDREVIICANGREAIDHIEGHEGTSTYFLILLDLNMPVMSGWEFLDSLEGKEYYSRVFVVVVSSSDYDSDRMHALAHERVLGFFPKPIDQEAVKKIMNMDVLNFFFTEY